MTTVIFAIKKTIFYLRHLVLWLTRSTGKNCNITNLVV